MTRDEMIERANDAFTRAQLALERKDENEFHLAAEEHEGFAQLYQRECIGATVQ